MSRDAGVVDPAALSEIRALLGDRPRRADLLIEHLHLIQDHHGRVSARHLAALAAEMAISADRVAAIARACSSIEVAAEGGSPPTLTVRVCDGLSCEMMGAPRLLAALGRALGSAARVARAPCMGRCDKAPVAAIGRRHVERADLETLVAALEAPLPGPSAPRHVDLEEYEWNGGYHLYRACLAGERVPDDVIGVIEASGLRGLGGDGVPTGRKWRLVRGRPAPRTVVVNGSEAEPGSFKDRVCLESDPHRVIEGALIAAWAVGARDIFVALRDEYSEAHAVLGAEIAKLQAAGLPSAACLELRRGAGGYLSGEETALIESLEGRPALPRRRPPAPAEAGLFGRPTLVNNVESLYWVRDILERGASWFTGQGRHGAHGLRMFSVSGRVKAPGLKLAPAGITLTELLEAYCEGMAEHHRFAAYLIGGARGRLLPASMADLPLDFDSLAAAGASIGAGAIVVLSERDDIGAAATNLRRFLETEAPGLGLDAIAVPPCAP